MNASRNVINLAVVLFCSCHIVSCDVNVRELIRRNNRQQDSTSLGTSIKANSPTPAKALASVTPLVGASGTTSNVIGRKSTATAAAGSHGPTPHRRGSRSAADNDGPLTLRCGQECSCSRFNKTIYREEYRVICNNTRQQMATLSTAVFAGEGPPSWTLQVYVRVEDTVALMVTPGFVSRWIAYTSSALDIWRVGDIVLPRGPIERATTQALRSVFAGLGIKDSSLSGIPRGILAGMDEYGLDLQNVTMPVLNIYNLVQPNTKTLRYLRVNNSIIGSIRGMEEFGADPADTHCCRIILKKWLRGPAGVSITNSQIGVVEANGLSFTSADTIRLDIVNTTIGRIKKSGLRLMNKIEPRIINTTVNLDGEGAFVMDNDMKLVATGNRIVLPKNIFNNWTCERNEIHENEFILVVEPHVTTMVNDVDDVNSIPSEGNQAEETRHQQSILGQSLNENQQTSLVDNFIHSSCVNENKILNAPINIESDSTAQSSSDDGLDRETILPSTSSETFQTISSHANSTSENHIHVHKVWVYLVFSGVGVLIIIVFVFAGILATRNKRADDQDDSSGPSRERKPSLMYVPGSAVYGNDTWSSTPSTQQMM